MHLHRRLLFVAVLPALAFAIAPNITAMGTKAAGPKNDSQVHLVRPNPAPEPAAKGTLRIRSKANSDRFDVRLQQVNVGQQHDLYLENPSDSGTFVLVLGLNISAGKLALALDTKKGDILPLGVATVDELIGRRAEIRQGSDVVLTGTVPPFGLSTKPAKASTLATAPDGSPAPDMTANLQLRAKDDKGQERILLKAHHVPWILGPFHVFIEDSQGSNTFTQIGELEEIGKSNGRYRADTVLGEALPFGVDFVSELSGRNLQVRDDGGVVFIEATIPAVQ